MVFGWQLHVFLMNSCASYSFLLTFPPVEAHWMPFFLDNDPHLLPLPSGYQEEISHWEWLLLIRTLRSEKLTFAAKVFVRHILGDSFAEAPGNDFFTLLTH